MQKHIKIKKKLVMTKKYKRTKSIKGKKNITDTITVSVQRGTCHMCTDCGGQEIKT
jgi:hypothetical protein